MAEAFPQDGSSGNAKGLNEVIARGLTPQVATDYERWQPLHWAIEVPDVMERGGFDAIIGNPPFLVHKRLSAAIGENLRKYCLNVLAAGRSGKCDQVVFFLLRAAGLAKRPSSTIGLLTAKGVAEGSSRETGLSALVDGTRPAWRLYAAVRSRKWPGKASVYYSVVWMADTWNGAVILDGEVVPSLNSMLDAASAEITPSRIPANTHICHQGVILQGKGFVVTPAEAQAWIDADPINAEVLFPYLNGEELNSRSRPSASRWVIDFNDRSEAEASRYRLPFQRVLTEVKPVRAENNRKVYRDYWWQYAEKRPEMRKRLAQLSEYLAIVGHTKFVIPTRVSTEFLPSSALRVFCTESYSLQAFLSSSIHVEWAVKWGSTLGDSIRYNPSVVFDSIPLPPNSEALEDLGRRLDNERHGIMKSRDVGLTDVYNLINNPEVNDDADVLRMRTLHIDIDAAVMAAYDWEDIPLDHGFHTYRRSKRFTLSPSAWSKILERLLQENLDRTSSQAATGPQAQEQLF